jgi:hypothetical protein
MKYTFRYVVSLLIPAILFLVAGFVLGACVNKQLSLYFYLASGGFFIGAITLAIVGYVQSCKRKKDAEKNDK